MSKKTLIKTIASNNGITHDQAEGQIHAVLAGLIDTIQNHGEIRLSGFGTFKVVRREARDCRHPGTGKMMTIEARNIVKFIPSPVLEEGV